MKKAFLVLSLTIVFIGFSVRSWGQTGKEKTIYIASVNFYLLTSVGVNCDEFEMRLKSRLLINVVRSVDSIRMLESCLKGIKYKRKEESIGVRAKFLYKDDSNKTIIICTDG